MINLFDDLPARAADEIFTEVLARESVRIERIVSTGQSTPTDKPHCQAHDCQSASDRDPRSASAFWAPRLTSFPGSQKKNTIVGR